MEQILPTLQENLVHPWDFLWGSCCVTFSSVYGHNVTSNKTNIRSLHQIVELELSEYGVTEQK